jgi:hypothetical protein
VLAKSENFPPDPCEFGVVVEMLECAAYESTDPDHVVGTCA